MRKSGFTLVEILVVITVVALLLALLVPAGFVVVGMSREASTKATLSIVGAIIGERERAFGDTYDRNPARTKMLLEGIYKSESDLITSDPSLSNSDKITFQSRLDGVFNPMFSRINNIAGTNELIEKILVRREYLRIFFPQNWDEAEFMLVKARKAPVDLSSKKNNENSEVLYWMVTSGYAVGSHSVDAESIPRSAIRDTDGNGLLEIVDNWGTPIQFIRWPTRILRSDGISATYPPGSPPAITGEAKNMARALYGSVPGNLASCPDDAADMVGSVSGKSPSEIESSYFLPATYSHSIILSAGPDTDTGIENPKSGNGFWGRISDPSKVFDNITQLNLKPATM